MLAQDFKAATLNPNSLSLPVITWEKLPDDFILPDDPVDNIHQNPIANALSETLSLAGLVSETAFTCTDYGLIANVNGKVIAKAPDWAYIPHITVSRDEIDRSYTPYLEGEVPTIVIEVISATDGGEYSKDLLVSIAETIFVPNFSLDLIVRIGGAVIIAVPDSESTSPV